MSAAAVDDYDGDLVGNYSLAPNFPLLDHGTCPSVHASPLFFLSLSLGWILRDYPSQLLTV